MLRPYGLKRRLNIGHYTLPAVLLLLLVSFPDDALGQWVSNGGNINNTNAGNVGVGTSSPGAKQHIVGNAGAPDSAAPSALTVVGGMGGAPCGSCEGREGGGIFLTAGGGSGAWNGSAGSGGGISLRGGLGGSPSAGGPLAGTGGVLSFFGGVGGSTNYGLPGGRGGALNLMGGAGGNNNALRDGGGPGGSVVINGGAGGTGQYVGAAGNVILADQRGNVGIGTANPGALLAVHKDQAAGTEVRVSNGNAAGFAGLYLNGGFSHTSGGFVQWNNTTGSSNLFVGTGGATPLYLGTNNAVRLSVLPASGNVGVGTTSPGFRLDVQGGQVNASGGVCIAGDCKTAWSQAGAWTTAGANIHYGAGNVGVGTSSPSAKFDVNGSFRSWAGSQGDVGISHSGLVSTFKAASTVQLALGANGTEVIRINNAGQVGIGTPTPTADTQYKLHVEGGVYVSGNLAAKYQDVAEWVPTAQALAPATVVIIDPSRRNHVLASVSAYDTAVAGVVSEMPGLILGEGGEGKVKVATTGRVKVRVDASRGAIMIGDLLVTSEFAGVAMKSKPITVGGRKIHAPGTIIGKALEPLAAGSGEILVLLSLQ